VSVVDLEAPVPRHVFYEWLGRRVTASPRLVSRIERLLDVAAHFTLPAWCAGCDRPLPLRVSPLGLCSGCRANLPPPPALHHCPPALDGLVAAWSYLPPIDEVVRRLKYGQLEFLAVDLAAGVAAAIPDADRFDWVTAVPLHWRRRLERGYDQAEAIAVPVARHAGLPFRRVLVRTRATPPQAARTAAARRANVAGAFRCRPGSGSGLEGAQVLLVDDVATTGATLEAAGMALRAGGAARVTGLVAALVPAFAGRHGPRYNRRPGLG
jgi:ComF family protein